MASVDRYKVHQPKYGSHINSKNLSIVKRYNKSFNALGGSTFGSGNPDMVTIIQDFDLKEGSSTKLTADFKLNTSAGYTGGVKFSGGGFATLRALKINFNGQYFCDQNGHVANVVQLVRNLYQGQAEYEQTKLSSLEDQNLVTVAGQTLQLELDLGLAGSELHKFLMTGGGVGKLEISIQFETRLERVFWGAEDAGETVNGYTLTNCKISSDMITYDAKVQEQYHNTYKSKTGIEFPTFAYSATPLQLQAAATHHIMQPQIQARNLTNTWILPIPTSPDKNNSGISTVDIVANSTYTNKNYPKNFKLKLNGVYVNPRSTDGASGKAVLYNGALKTAFKNPDEREVAWNLTQKFKTDDYQVLAASFLRGNELSPFIINNGMSTFQSNNQLDLEFDTEAVETTKSVLVINQYTAILSIDASGTYVRK